MSAEKHEIDESLYSRQLYVLGHEAQRKMAHSNILLAGLNGLGIEAAKNVVLAGVKSVTLFDNQSVSYVDLASQFYFNESVVGQNRAAVSAPRLAELNPYVHIHVLQTDLKAAVQTKAYSLVVLVGLDWVEQVELAELCHAHGIAVITGDSRGVFGSIFCDFGDNFAVHDVDGEPAATSMIASITNDSPALVTVLEETRHNLETGDVVTFTEIQGMVELNKRSFPVVVKDRYSFEIDVDATAFNRYVRGGYITQVKQPVHISFDSISKSFHNPGTFNCDFVKMDRAAALHLAFYTLHRFKAQHGRLPAPGSDPDGKEFVSLARSLNAELKKTEATCHMSDEEFSAQSNLLYRFALCAQGQVGPICALLGGVLGQEIIKACSGKFMPIRQWFYYDAFEVLSDEPLPSTDVAPLNCRYDGQIMVFGKSVQHQLSSLSLFLVGAGAIGCEMIKNWAMMGIASDFHDPSTSEPSPARGLVHVTDMDQIEKSNLSRQFLFRNSDINKPKSTTAVRAATSMNPSFNAVAYEQKVAADTEVIFNDDFFESLSMVCTALDNVEARLYIDQRCMFYQLPMLESGTLGAKGHTQVVVPFITENYGATRDPPEKSIPVCTLKHFPNQIDHTLQWAREWFEETYRQVPEDVNQYLESPSEFLNSSSTQAVMKLDNVQKIKESVVDFPVHTFADCIVWSRSAFEDLFANRIKQLLHNFPLDRITASGTPFWSGSKLPPTPLVFDLSDPLHYEYLVSCALLRAEIYGLADTSFTREDVAAILNTYQVPTFTPQSDVKIAATEEEAKADTERRMVAANGEETLRELISAIPSKEVLGSNYHLNSIDFDKDTDSHMRVVAAASNLRARNYRIPEADLHKSRGIAGKITPAIATTTALVTGAICVELFKILAKKPITKYQNSFYNLAIPLFTSMEPEPPKAHKAIVKGNEWKWTQWDRVDIEDPDMTLGGLINYLLDQYGVELSMLSSGVTMLYSSFSDQKKAAMRKPMKLRDVVEQVTKKTIPVNQKYLILELLVNDDETGDEVDIPYLRFKLR